MNMIVSAATHWQTAYSLDVDVDNRIYIQGGPKK